MSTDLDRRVNETARFVVDVLARDAFEPQGAAIRSIQQVRLVHAAVRFWLKERNPWPDEAPLNQEDLLGTLMSFSVVVVRAVRRLGVSVGATEADDFYHLWRVTGALLGVEPALLPSDFAAAEATSNLIAARQFRESSAGKQLVQALRTRINQHVPVPGMTDYLMRRLSGDRVADLLGIPGNDAFRNKLGQLARWPFVDRVALGKLLPQLSATVGKPLLDNIITRKLGGELAGFAAPTSSMMRNMRS
jgi:hypothetical protein